MTPGQEIEDWAGLLRRVVEDADTAPTYAAAAKAYRCSADAPATVEGFVTVRLAILRNVTVEPWLPEFFVALLQRGVKADFVIGDYAVYEEYAREPARFGLPAPDHVLAYFDPVALGGDARHDLPPDLSEVLTDRIRGIVANLLSHTDGTVIVSNLGPDPFTYHTLHGDQDSSSWLQCRRAVNAALVDLLDGEPRSAILDMDRVIGEYGATRAHDPRMYLSVRNPFAVDFLPRLAAAFADIVAAAVLPAKKCIVVDCDNTLWGGILGEDGPEGVEIGTGYPGEAYRQFHLFLRGLTRRGMLLAINSKNNEHEVLSFLERSPDTVLRIDDFAAHRVNWSDKASNLRELAEELNVGLDALVFVDDSPVECERVRTAFPEVQVERFPADPAEISGFLRRLRTTERLWVTEDDVKRNVSMRGRVASERLLRDAPDFASFLRSLKIRLGVVREHEGAVDRISQLTQRTNQFNLTTKRYSARDIEGLMSEGIIYTMSMKDRFADYGLIAVAIIAPEPHETWEIDSFLLSCRAFGRDVEVQFLRALLDDARENGAEFVRARYVATARNGMTRDFFRRQGFRVLHADEHECRYELSLRGREFAAAAAGPHDALYDVRCVGFGH